MARKRYEEEDYEDEEDEYEDEETTVEDDIILKLRKMLTEMDPVDERYGPYSRALRDAMDRRRIDVETRQARVETRQAEIAVENARDAKLAMFLPAIIQGGSTLLTTAVSYAMNRRTVNNVLEFEERGNILNTKAAGMIDRPLRK